MATDNCVARVKETFAAERSTNAQSIAFSVQREQQLVAQIESDGLERPSNLVKQLKSVESNLRKSLGSWSETNFDDVADALAAPSQTDGDSALSRLEEVASRFEKISVKSAKSVQLSKASETKMVSVCDTIGLASMVNKPVPLSAKVKNYTPWEKPWPQRNEVKDSPAALLYLDQQLAALGVTGDNGDYKLVDIRGQLQCLSFVFDDTPYKGTADAMLVPSAVAETFARVQARVIFDWKLPTEIDRSGGQALAELIGGVVHSRHEIMVVFTDLVNKSNILKITGGAIHRYKNIDMSSMLGIVLSFILQSSSDPEYGKPVEDQPEGIKNIKKKVLGDLHLLPANLLDFVDGESPAERSLQFASILHDMYHSVPFPNYFA